MRARILDQRGFVAGATFLAIGALAIGVAARYDFGTTRHMGPGYFPTMLGGLLALTGASAMLRALAFHGEGVGRFAWRPALAATAGVLLFAALVDRGGLVVAVLALALVGGLGARRARKTELLVIAIVLAALSLGIFYYGLSLPFTPFGRP